MTTKTMKKNTTLPAAGLKSKSLWWPLTSDLALQAAGEKKPLNESERGEMTPSVINALEQPGWIKEAIVEIWLHLVDHTVQDVRSP